VAAAKDTPAEPSKLIKLDSDDKNKSDDDAHVTFEGIKDIKAIKVRDKGDSVLNYAI
jgi:hypothetical protein